MEIILASSSPRRLSLLNEIGIQPVVFIPDIIESIGEGETPSEMVLRLAIEKAEAVARRCAHGLVIAADTAVVIDHICLGKPSDEIDAAAMLRLLSGRTHAVLTGLAVLDITSHVMKTCLAETSVTFRILSEDDISEYIATGEPMDKAGAYAIQGRAANFIEAVEGSVSNVIGLPMERLRELLGTFGVYPL